MGIGLQVGFEGHPLSLRRETVKPITAPANYFIRTIRLESINPFALIL